MMNLNDMRERSAWMKNPDWYTIDLNNGFGGYVLKENAPEEAKKSFELWKKYCAEHAEKGE